jgi:hypothetical protein
MGRIWQAKKANSYGMTPTRNNKAGRRRATELTPSRSTMLMKFPRRDDGDRRPSLEDFEHEDAPHSTQ